MQNENFYDVLSKDGKTTHFGVKHYFYRVEFQARGAPHIHCLLWLERNDEDKQGSRNLESVESRILDNLPSVRQMRLGRRVSLQTELSQLCIC